MHPARRQWRSSWLVPLAPAALLATLVTALMQVPRYDVYGLYAIFAAFLVGVGLAFGAVGEAAVPDRYVQAEHTTGVLLAALSLALVAVLLYLVYGCVFGCPG